MAEQKDWWRVVPNTDGFYEISRMGEVRSWKNSRWPGRKKAPALLTPFKDNQGNYVVKMTYDGKSRQKIVMSLMVDIWCGGRPDGLNAYHINGMRDDNRLQNIGFKPYPEICKKTGAMCGKRKPVVKINDRGEIVKFYKSARQAGLKNYMSPQTVSDCCKGRNKRRKTAPDGYYYKYEEDMRLECEVAD